jgi:hypothetical protein
MRSVIQRASQALTKTDKEKILQAFGLHDIEVYSSCRCVPINIKFFIVAFSDPYAASSYDTLHSDELGKWGKHIWELLLTVLAESGKKGELTRK